MQTNNPAFPANTFDTFGWAEGRSTTMTVQGTALKAFVLLAILTATAGWSWSLADRGELTPALLFGSLVGGLVVFFVTLFKKTWAPITGPLYAALEGVLLGAITQMFNVRYQGIAVQAVALTCGVTFFMLVIYSTRLIRVTDRLRAGIFAATGAVALLYLASILLSFFSVKIPVIFDATPLGIVFSLFVVGLAAFNLLLDFDFIEKGERSAAPKYMEWYAAFGLMVTLIWLYMEVLRLLSKLRDR